VFDSWYLQVCWFLAGANDDVSTLRNLVAHLNRRSLNKVSTAMERCNASLDKLSFAFLRNRFGECALKTHQLGPINLQLLGPDSIPIHSPDPINRIRSTHKHLFRIATAQCAGTAERPRIDKCHLPSGRATAMGHSRCSRPGSNNYHVELFGHAFTSPQQDCCVTSALACKQPKPAQAGNHSFLSRVQFITAISFTAVSLRGVNLRNSLSDCYTLKQLQSQADII
jgi:hypothetical protein